MEVFHGGNDLRGDADLHLRGDADLLKEKVWVLGSFSVDLFVVDLLLSPLLNLLIECFVKTIDNEEVSIVRSIFVRVSSALGPSVDIENVWMIQGCLLYTSPSPRDKRQSRMPSSA